MADNKTNKGEPDRSRINTNEDYEVKYWARKFGVTATELKKAVKYAGTKPEDVAAYLQKR